MLKKLTYREVVEMLSRGGYKCVRVPFELPFGAVLDTYRNEAGTVAMVLHTNDADEPAKIFREVDSI